MQFELLTLKSNGWLFSKRADTKEKGLSVKNKNIFGTKKKRDLKLIILCYLLGILKIAYAFYMQ